MCFGGGGMGKLRDILDPVGALLAPNKSSAPAATVDPAAERRAAEADAAAKANEALISDARRKRAPVRVQSGE